MSLITMLSLIALLLVDIDGRLGASDVNVASRCICIMIVWLAALLKKLWNSKESDDME